MKKLILVVVMMVMAAPARAALQFGLVDFKHPQTSIGTFFDYKGHSDGGGVLALVLLQDEGKSSPWVPLTIGGTMGQGLGGPSVSLGTGYNLLPGAKAVVWAILQFSTGLDDSKFKNIKELLAPPDLGKPDMDFFFGPQYSLVFTAPDRAKTVPTLFAGGTLKF